MGTAEAGAFNRTELEGRKASALVGEVAVPDLPSISVVIPLYNKAPYIGRALSSVLAQTFQDFEVVVVDDGSTDAGASIVEGSTDLRVRLVHQENRGVSAARNRGIEEAKAELIAFLDADDEWAADHLATLLRLRKRFPEAGAYGTAYLIAWRDKRSGQVVTRRRISKRPRIPLEPWEGVLPSYFQAAALGYTPITASNAAIARSVLNEMGGFSTEAWWGEDSDLWGRIALRYPVAFSWEGLVVYHTDASNRATLSVQPVKEHLFVTTARTEKEAGRVPMDMEKDLREYIALKKIQTAQRNLAAKRPDLARANLMDCQTRHLWRMKYATMLRVYLSLLRSGFD